MNRQVQMTSLLAYQEIRPRLGKKQKEVYKILKAARDTHFYFSNCELAFFLNWPINTVVPRVKELRDLGLVVLSRKRLCERTGRLVMAWKAKETEK